MKKLIAQTRKRIWRKSGNVTTGQTVVTQPWIPPAVPRQAFSLQPTITPPVSSPTILSVSVVTDGSTLQHANGDQNPIHGMIHGQHQGRLIVTPNGDRWVVYKFTQNRGDTGPNATPPVGSAPEVGHTGTYPTAVITEKLSINIAYQAGGSGAWSLISTIDNTDDDTYPCWDAVNSVLHVVFVKKDSGTTRNCYVRTLNASGQIGSDVLVQGDWNFGGNVGYTGTGLNSGYQSFGSANSRYGAAGIGSSGVLCIKATIGTGSGSEQTDQCNTILVFGKWNPTAGWSWSQQRILSTAMRHAYDYLFPEVGPNGNLNEFTILSAGNQYSGDHPKRPIHGQGFPYFFDAIRHAFMNMEAPSAYTQNEILDYLYQDNAYGAYVALTGSKFPWTFDSATGSADPGSGKVRFNNATLSSVTQIYISNTDSSSASKTSFIASFDDETHDTQYSADYGYIRIWNQADSDSNTNYVVFKLTGAVTNNGAWTTVPVSYVANGGTISNTNPLYVQSNNVDIYSRLLDAQYDPVSNRIFCIYKHVSGSLTQNGARKMPGIWLFVVDPTKAPGDPSAVLFNGNISVQNPGTPSNYGDGYYRVQPSSSILDRIVIDDTGKAYILQFYGAPSGSSSNDRLYVFPLTESPANTFTCPPVPGKGSGAYEIGSGLGNLSVLAQWPTKVMFGSPRISNYVDVLVGCSRTNNPVGDTSWPAYPYPEDPGVDSSHKWGRNCLKLAVIRIQLK